MSTNHKAKLPSLLKGTVKRFEKGYFIPEMKQEKRCEEAEEHKEEYCEVRKGEYNLGAGGGQKLFRATLQTTRLKKC